MKISLNQEEIQEALVNFVSEDFDISNKDVLVTMIAGRGKKGHSAVIEILPKGSISETTETTETEEPDAKTPAIDFES
jgi:hypothetical protein